MIGAKWDAPKIQSWRVGGVVLSIRRNIFSSHMRSSARRYERPGTFRCPFSVAGVSCHWCWRPGLRKAQPPGCRKFNSGARQSARGGQM